MVSGLYICIAQNKNLKYSLRLQYRRRGNSMPPTAMLSSFSFFLEITDKTLGLCVERRDVFSSELGLRLQPPAAGPEFPLDKNPAAVSKLCSKGARFQVRRRCQETERPHVLFASFIFPKKQAHSKIIQIVRFH